MHVRAMSMVLCSPQAAIHVELGALERLGELVPGDGPVEIVSDARVAGIHGMDAQLALGAGARASHELAPGRAGEEASSRSRLSGTRSGLERGGTLVALGGGCTTDVAGFAAATYLRGIDWVAVPTTLVGQVDAAIGGKTAIDLPDAKNLVGAFHWPVRTVIDPAALETLPEAELANGTAEVVKTGLLAGEPFWELPLAEQVRRSAAFKTALCLRDPHDRGDRAQLNLGHTFAHALEAAAAFELPHGRAVALGLLAALRLSGLDTRGRRASSSGPSPSGSTATRPGPPSHATRKSSTACRGSSCSRRRAADARASSCPRPKSERRSTP